MNIINKKKDEARSSLVTNDSRALSLRDTINQLVSESFWDPLGGLDHWVAKLDYPRVDMTESDKEIKLIADVPGLKPEDIDIDLDEDSLVLSGRNSQEVEEKNKKFYRYERQSGEFTRSFALPSRIKPAEATAEMKDGVLTLILPKESPTSKQKIKINKAD